MAFKFLIAMIAGMVSLTASKPIMVSFGTRQAPIIPASVAPTTDNPLAPRNAAPVFERIDDVPNINHYQAPTPHQYRKQIYSHKPNPNLILGTPLDIKYTPSLESLYHQKLEFAKSVGLSYTGPQQFDVQEYQIEKEKERVDKLKGLSSSQHFVQQYQSQRRYEQGNASPNQVNHLSQYQVQEPQNTGVSSYQYSYQGERKFVPEIGIVYSSGLRYYVPQIVYYNVDAENSVFDKNEIHHRQKH